MKETYIHKTTVIVRVIVTVEIYIVSKSASSDLYALMTSFDSLNQTIAIQSDLKIACFQYKKNAVVSLFL